MTIIERKSINQQSESKITQQVILAIGQHTLSLQKKNPP